MCDKKNGYVTGYVGIIDVLGFGDFSMNDNFHRIYSMTQSILYSKRNFERNLKNIKFALLSDTVVVMIEANQNTQDYAFFQSILSNIGLIRTFILNHTGLYSRAAISFGEYFYDNSTNVVFGPAITKAAKLAEHSDKYIDSCIDERFAFRPAAIIIDDVYCTGENNDYHDYLLGSCIFDYMANDVRISRIGNSNFHLYNPYFEAFQDYLFTSKCETDYGTNFLFESFCKRERKRLADRIKQSNSERKEKYRVEQDMLCFFENSFKKSGPLY